MKKVLFILVLFIFSATLFAQDKKDDNLELLRLFPKIACIGSSLASGEIVSDPQKAPGILFGSMGKEKMINELPACVDRHESSWCSLICRRIGAKAKHWSRGGITARYWLEHYNYLMQTDPEVYPCYFIYLGGNDFYAGYQIGTPKDDLKSNTFSGYYNEVINCIKAKNPHAVILCLSMFTNSDYKNKNNNTQKDFSNAVKAITEVQDLCYYIDFAGTSENVLEKSKYINGGHYSSPGYLVVSYEIEALANKVLLENIHDLDDITLYF